MKGIQIIAVIAVICACYINALPAKNSKRYSVTPTLYVPLNAPLTHGMMYLQYVQPRRSNGRLTDVSEVSAFAAGGTVAMGTQIRGGRDPDDVLEDELNDRQLPGLPAEGVLVPVDVLPDRPADPEQEPTPQGDVESVDEKSGEQPAEPTADKPADNDSAATDEEPAATNLVPRPVAPSPPRRKVYVSLDSPRRSKPQPAPVGNVFGVDLGRIGGGAIAIANSYSTGYGGAARSQATAYGSPFEVKSRRH